jgi:transcriptional regulator with XRE-family HTH domain
MEFGRRLRLARTRRGLSQEGLARRVDASKNSVQNWERNDTLPRAEAVAALALALGVSADYLLGLSDVPEPVGSSSVGSA